MLRIDGVIRVFTLSRPNFHRVQCKFEDPFSAGRLASSPLTTLYVCRHVWSAHAHKFAAPWVLSFGCCRRKKDFCIPDCTCVFVWMGSTNVPNFSLIGWKTKKLLGVKVSDIPYQLWTASLSLMWPSPIGMKLVPDERSGPMSPWGQVPKISYRPFFELWPLKVDIC